MKVLEIKVETRVVNSPIKLEVNGIPILAKVKNKKEADHKGITIDNPL